MKKSINIWSFVGKTNREAMKIAKDAGFEGIELALGAEGEISMTSTDEELLSIKVQAGRAGKDLGVAHPAEALITLIAVCRYIEEITSLSPYNIFI